MSEDRSDQGCKKKSETLNDAIQRAKRHTKNVGAEGLDEPEGFASGKALRRDLQEGLDQLDRGEGKPLDMDAVKAKARAIRETKL